MTTINDFVEQLQGYQTLSATYDVRDDNLRLYALSRFAKEDYELLTSLKFRPAPKQGCLFAKWSPRLEDFLLALCGEIDDEQSTPEERAERRAERFEQYSENRQKESNDAYEAVNAIASHIPPGQPILAGHHSEKRHRRDLERMDNGMRRSVNLWKSAEYWKQRARASLLHAERKERPDVRYRRIKKLEKEVRDCQKSVDKYQAHISQWENATDLTVDSAIAIASAGYLTKAFPLDKYPRPADKSQSEEKMSLCDALRNEIITPERCKELSLKSYVIYRDHYQRWIDHLQNRITYEKAMLVEQEGGLLEDKWKDIQVGGKILTGYGSWWNVIRVNRSNGKIVSVTAKDPNQTGYFSEWKYTLEKIRDYKPPEAGSKPVRILICNYPGEGVREITSEEWNKTHRDSKGIDTVTCNGVTYKVRRKMFLHCLAQVFLTDKKVVHPPVAAV